MDMQKQVFIITRKNYDNHLINRIERWVKHGNEVHLLYVIQPLPVQYMQLPNAQDIVVRLKSEAKSRLKDIGDALKLGNDRMHVAIGLTNTVPHELADTLGATVINLATHATVSTKFTGWVKDIIYLFRNGCKEVHSIFSLSHTLLTSTWNPYSY